MPAAILHLLGTAQPEGSGIARIVAALASGLDPSRYSVHAWFLGPEGPLADELRSAGASVKSIPWWRGARDPAGAYRFWRSFRKHDFAAVHQHFGARSVRQLIRLSSNAPLILHLHGRISELNGGSRVSIDVSGADAVIAVSKAVALQVTGFKPAVIYSGVKSGEEFRRRCTGSSEIVVGAACRLVPLKGLMHLIRAMALLCPEYPTLRLEIAGAGPQQADLEKEADELGLAGKVRFLGWQRDLSRVIQGWDIYVTSTLEEGFPVAVLEAGAEGLPVVATAVGGLPEVVEDGQTGFLVPASDSFALADRLRILINDPARRLAMGAAGWKRVRTCFSAERMVRDIATVYDSLVA